MKQGLEVEYLRHKNFSGDWLHKLWRFLKEEADRVVQGSWYSKIDDTDRRRLDNLLQPLGNWSVFPVIRKGKPCLFPLRRATAAIDLDQGDSHNTKGNLTTNKTSSARLLGLVWKLCIQGPWPDKSG